jgi:hypothetical protein
MTLRCIHFCNALAESAVTLSSSNSGSHSAEQDLKQTNSCGHIASCVNSAIEHDEDSR